MKKIFTGILSFLLMTSIFATPITNGVVYSNGSALQTMAAGTSGQFLQSQGPSSAPFMASLSGPITGITNGSNASTGVIGELQNINVPKASAISLTTNQVTDVGSITVGAGDWDIRAIVGFSGGAVTGTQSLAFIGTAAGNNTTGLDLSLNAAATILVASAVSDITLVLPTYRVDPTTTTTYYLKARSLFTIGSATVYGTLEARRAR